MVPSPPTRKIVLAVRLTAGEHATLAGRAQVANLPISTYLRREALEHRVRSSGQFVRESDVDELVDLGVRLNRLAHLANSRGHLVAEEELALVLGEIRTALDGLSSRISK